MCTFRTCFFLALTFVVGLCGCQGYCVNQSAYTGYGACDGYPVCGPDPCSCGPYSDCVDAGFYGDDMAYGEPPLGERLTLKERLRGRRELRAARREARHGRHPRGRRGLGDPGAMMGGCFDCCYDDCCGGCGPCCDGGMMPCGFDCGPCMGCDSGWMDGGMTADLGMTPGMTGPGGMTYGGGGCPMNSGMGAAPETFVPYSFEASPTPHPPGGMHGAPMPSPDSREQQAVPNEGNFEPAPNDGSSVIHGRQSSAQIPQTLPPLRQTQWVPSGF